MNINSYIDHTLLKPTATKEDIINLVNEAIKYSFASVCVNPFWVSMCKELLKGTNVKVCTVVGFPLGASNTSVKKYETTQAIIDGADEIDMVINLGALKSKQYNLVTKDIETVVKSANGKIVKVIIETCLLTDYEKELACDISLKAGATYVKTSTGFASGGATVSDIILMKNIVNDKARIKASGGIDSYEKATEMIKLGASRIGTSKGIKIVEKN